jgi:hypothetical protein
VEAVGRDRKQRGDPVSFVSGRAIVEEGDYLVRLRERDGAVSPGVAVGPRRFLLI